MKWFDQSQPRSISIFCKQHCKRSSQWYFSSQWQMVFMEYMQNMSSLTRDRETKTIIRIRMVHQFYHQPYYSYSTTKWNSFARTEELVLFWHFVCSVVVLAVAVVGQKAFVSSNMSANYPWEYGSDGWTAPTFRPD